MGMGFGSTLVDDRVKESTEIDTNTGNHDKFSHYVKKTAILSAAVEGTPAIALCGKVWVPNEDGKKYSVCPTCKEIYETLKE